MQEPTFDFEVDGHKFQSRRLDPFDQMLVLKRVMPLVGPLIPLAMQIEAISSGNSREGMNVLAELIGPFSEALAQMKDEDLRWLMEKCLSTLKFEKDGQMTAFWNRSARKCQYDDMADIALFLPLTVRVIQENLGPFLLARLTGRRASETVKPPPEA